MRRYVALWMVAVYFPFCHMVWGGPGALLADMGVIDFAGGIVVHITAGIGALVGCIMLGPRKENKLACDNLTLTCLGTGMLWVRSPPLPARHCDSSRAKGRAGASKRMIEHTPSRIP